MCETFNMLGNGTSSRRLWLVGGTTALAIATTIGLGWAAVQQAPPPPSPDVHVWRAPMKKAHRQEVDAKTQEEVDRQIAEAMKQVDAAMKEVAEAMKGMNVDIDRDVESEMGQSIDTPAVHTDVPPIHVHVPAIKTRVPAIHIHIPPIHTHDKNGRAVDVPEIRVDVPEIKVDVPDIHVDVPAIHVDVPKIHVDGKRKSKE